jgi:cytochrome c oxidase subunit 3
MLALESRERAPDRHLTTYGALVYAVAIVAAFGALLAAYVTLRSGLPVWPPKGVKLQDYYGNTLSITMLIVVVVAEWSAWAVRREERSQAIGAFAILIVLGAAFLNLLSYVVSAAHFGPGSHPYGAVYFSFAVLTAVSVGVAMIATIVTLVRMLGAQVSAREPALARSTAWLWHAAVIGWFIVYFAEYQIK